MQRVSFFGNEGHPTRKFPLLGSCTAATGAAEFAIGVADLSGGVTSAAVLEKSGRQAEDGGPCMCLRGRFGRAFGWMARVAAAAG